MTKKVIAALCLAVSVALWLDAVVHGHAMAQSLLAAALGIGWTAFLLPALLPVLALEQLTSGYAPWANGHAATTLNLAAGAVLIWLFPVNRLLRRFGWFDALQDDKRRPARFTRGLALALDMVNKRLFGRQKTGDWAWIGMLATRYSKGDFFLGRMALWGRFGTLWPSGLEPDGLGITIGRPGSGKSTAAAIPAVCLHDGPGLFFDPKGEITRACYAVRGAGGNGVRGRGDKTFVVDPVNLTGLPKSRYNPLHEIAQERSTDDALRLMFKLAEGLVRNPGGTGENSWVYTGARDFAYGLIAFVVTHYPPEICNLVTVRRLLQGDPDRLRAAKAEKIPGIVTPFDALLLRMTEEASGPFGEVIAGQAVDVVKMGDRQRGTILKALSEATLWLDLPQFQDAVSGCDFLLRDFRTERISVFVCLPLNELTGIASGFMRFFLTMFMQIMYRAPAPPRAGPVLCLVDEFPQFGKIEDFCKIGPTMRSYGVKLWILLQDINQARVTYGREETSTFLGCAAFVQIMAMKHEETIDYLVRALGERVVKERQPDGRVIERPHPLLDREQACRYLTARDGNQIVLRFNDRPLRLKTAPYFWYLPYWRYTPDPAYPEPRLRAWARRRAVRQVEKAKQRATGKKG